MCVCVCMYVWVDVCVCVCGWMCVHACVYIWMCLRVHEREGEGMNGGVEEGERCTEMKSTMYQCHVTLHLCVRYKLIMNMSVT